jgi:putative hydrolase of the HAD superfamily
VGKPLWLFDLDDTLHDASYAAFGPISQSMTEYIVRHLGLPVDQASDLRHHYWKKYGATLLGLVRHHGVKIDHFLHETHCLPGLESRLRCSAHDRSVLRHLPGRKIILTNAPRAYALRVLKALRLHRYFEKIIGIEDMRMFGHTRPKPDVRMLRCWVARLKVPAHRCVLIEDTQVNQRAAFKVGMRAVWMQRYALTEKCGTKAGVHHAGKPHYVHARIHSLKLLRLLT